MPTTKLEDNYHPHLGETRIIDTKVYIYTENDLWEGFITEDRGIYAFILNPIPPKEVVIGSFTYQKDDNNFIFEPEFPVTQLSVNLSSSCRECKSWELLNNCCREPGNDPSNNGYKCTKFKHFQE